MKSVMQHNFAHIEQNAPARATFNRSAGYKTTFSSGRLIPFFVEEILPGDSVHLRTDIFARLATPLKPFMDNLFLETFYFFVPCRLVWDHWQNFQGEKVSPTDTTEYLLPQATWYSSEGVIPWQNIADYFGLPVGLTPSAGMPLSVNALPFRGYNLIWNEWFRDQNLQDPVSVVTGDGPDSIAQYGILRRCKKHDYFTSCLPWPQKGPGVELPLFGTAPVYGDGHALGLFGHMDSGDTNFGLVQLGAGSCAMNTGYGATAGTSVSIGNIPVNLNALGVPVRGTGTPPVTGLIANLSEAYAGTINDIRTAFQLQRLLERDARGGTRYIEILRAHWNVISPDARLQRPEFLGSSSQRININPVQQLSMTSGTQPLGQQGAYGTVYSGNGGFHKAFVEHGYIIGLMNVRADITYQGGLHKMWTRRERLDFAMPVLSHLGEQPVLNHEIFYEGDGAKDFGVFGYQERYAEYRYRPSIITGIFRSNYSQSLDFWHLSPDYIEAPALGATWIQDNPPIDRVVAVQSEPEFLCDVFFNLIHSRMLPAHGTPGLLDHL